MISILHLSDLHFGTNEDAENWSGQLADDLKNELSCRQLDILIISGDIATRALPEEYDAARLFLERVQKEFGLDSSQMVIVPGNHDLNWEYSERAYALKYKKDYKGDLRDGYYFEEGEKVICIRENEEEYARRFSPFREFYQGVKGESYPLDYENQGILVYAKEHNLLILGLNSSWQIDHHFTGRASIYPVAVTRALNTLRNTPEYANALKCAVWHHPLNSPSEDRITDHGFIERLAQCGFSFCIHGHLHKAEAGLYRYELGHEGRKLHIIGAGTFGAPVREWSLDCKNGGMIL